MSTSRTRFPWKASSSLAFLFQFPPSTLMIPASSARRLAQWRGNNFAGRQMRRISHTDVPSDMINLRNATIDDLELLSRWDDEEHLQDPTVMGDEDYNDWDWAKELLRSDLPWRFQLIAEIIEERHRPIGFVQIIDPAMEETHYWGSDVAPNLRAIDIWIGERDCLGKGYGTLMMKIALSTYCFSDPTVEAILVDPMVTNPKTHRFYRKLGFKPESLRQFGPDWCLVHRLTRDDYHAEYSTN